MCSAARWFLASSTTPRTPSRFSSYRRLRSELRFSLVTMHNRCHSTAASSNPTTAGITVIEPPRRFPSGGVDGKPPAHHLNDSGSKFQNPWPSFRFQDFSQWFRQIVTSIKGIEKIPNDVKAHIPTQVPTWGAEEGNEKKAKATWLGYAFSACFASCPYRRGISSG